VAQDPGGRRRLGALALKAPDQEVEGFLDDRQVEVLLGGEVAVQRSLADAGLAREVLHGDVMVDSGGEDARRPVEDGGALARVTRGSAGRRDGGWVTHGTE
jgi:hypothetical protein